MVVNKPRNLFILFLISFILELHFFKLVDLLPQSFRSVSTFSLNLCNLTMPFLLTLNFHSPLPAFLSTFPCVHNLASLACNLPTIAVRNSISISYPLCHFTLLVHWLLHKSHKIGTQWVSRLIAYFFANLAPKMHFSPDTYLNTPYRVSLRLKFSLFLPLVWFFDMFRASVGPYFVSISFLLPSSTFSSSTFPCRVIRCAAFGIWTDMWSKRRFQWGSSERSAEFL